jgi:hypothetical protein
LYNYSIESEKEMKMQSWNEMSPLEQAQCQYWDMYKDAYGSRPRGIDTSMWTLADFEKEFEFLAEVIMREETQRLADEKVAIAKFEDKVLNLMHTGTNRERVIAWLMDSADANGDRDYACFLFGLPYGYLDTATV